MGGGARALTSRRARRAAAEAVPALSPVTRLLERLVSEVARLEASAVGAALSRAVAAFLTAAGADAQGEVDVVCFGLGSLRYGSNPLLQLATLQVLVGACRAGDVAGSVHVALYDPLFDATDSAVLAALGHTVETVNTGGWRPLRLSAGSHGAEPPTHVPTLFFMPHCGADLNAAVIAANWGPALQRLCFIGNSLRFFHHCREESGPVAARLLADSQPGGELAANRARAEEATQRLLEVASLARHPAPAEAEEEHGGPPRLRGALEMPLPGPVGDDWEEVRRALDATSVHTFTWG